MKLRVRIGFAAFVSAFVILGLPVLAPAMQEPSQPPPKPAVSPAAGDKEEATKDEDFKEPTTGSEKARQKEIKKKACPAIDQGYSAETDEKQHPTPDPEADKAFVYVLRPTLMGNSKVPPEYLAGEEEVVGRAGAGS